MNSFAPFREKMERAGVNEAAILSFERNYNTLLHQGTTDIPESSIDPVVSLPSLDDVSDEAEKFNPELLAQTVVIKLNGGLGTSMGLQKAKSLLEVKDGSTFLDITVDQIRYLRETTGAKVKFLLMNSFSTTEDTMEHLQQYAADGFADVSRVEMMQNQIPKIDVNTMLPVEWPSNQELEWCPPGHGDLYTAIEGSGWLERLLESGVKYAFVSNSDNLGAVLHPGILRYFAESGMPFLMEVTRRTESDKKGGHLALRNCDHQLLLREVAQCPEADLEHFQNIDRHQYFNTNSLWIRLDALKRELDEQGGGLALPMITNRKTVDPRDKKSPEVYQLETAMGAAIECFKGAGAICVPRSRFAPVKTTADLFSLKSDAYEITEDGRVALIQSRAGTPPTVELSDEYKMVGSLEGLGIPSLKNAEKLCVRGPVRFSENVEIRGCVTIRNERDETKWVATGVYNNEEVTL